MTMSKQEEIKQALAVASTEHEWDTDGTFIEWKDGDVLQGTYRHIASTQAHTPEIFNNPNHENDANLIAKSPEYISYLLEENEKCLLEAQDWEDEYHALKRRYEELDKSTLEQHELLMDTATKFRAASKELEEARKIKFPRQVDEEGGWILDYKFLECLGVTMLRESDHTVDMEDIELVLLTLEISLGQEGGGKDE